MSNRKSNFFNADLIFKFSMFLLFLAIPLLVLFFWQENIYIDRTISHEKFGTFGDFFGGVLGSIWALCGVILFYLALKEQSVDFANNREALVKQIEALNIQTKEFSLQRTELIESRKIFTEQAKTLKLQRFESTFFSLIELYNKVILNLCNQDSTNNYFKSLKIKLEKNYVHCDCVHKTHQLSARFYLTLFYDNKEELGYYFRTIYRILSIIDNSELTDLEKIMYVKILRSQLSENELLIIYYNADTKYGKKLYSYILKYNLLKHLPILSKLEFNYYSKQMISTGDFHHFNSSIFETIKSFINNLNKNINNDSFEEEIISFVVDFDEYIFIKIHSDDTSILNIEFILPKERTEILNFSFSLFMNYFKSILSDFFIYSRYNNESKFKIEYKEVSNSTDIILIFIINSQVKIQINKD